MPASSRTRTPERHRLVLRAVPDRESRRAGEAGRGGQLAQHIGARVLRVLSSQPGELPEDDAAHLTKHARERKVSPHAVQPVRPLADVLEQEDGAFERREERRTQKPREHREIAAEERPFRHAIDVRFRAGEVIGRRFGLEKLRTGAPARPRPAVRAE